jgi:diguanylate cyclase (GGDEF)-like protein
MGKRNEIVVLVDSDEDILNPVAQIIRDRGYDVRVATSVRDAIELIMDSDPERVVVITDIDLGDSDGADGDGYDILEYIRRFEKHRALPFVWTSSTDNVGRALKYGARHVFTKPSSITDMCQHIETELLEYIAHSEARRDQERSNFDHKTGLLREEVWEEIALAKINRAIESGEQNVSLIHIDLDEFKSFNDEYSYEVGDAVVRKVGEVLRKGTKLLDSMHTCRRGGEGADEFLVLLPRLERINAQRIGERLLASALRHRIKHSDTKYGVQYSLSFSFSFGVGHIKLSDVTNSKEALTLLRRDAEDGVRSMKKRRRLVARGRVKRRYPKSRRKISPPTEPVKENGEPLPAGG